MDNNLHVIKDQFIVEHVILFELNFLEYLTVAASDDPTFREKATYRHNVNALFC